ncbi:Sulfoquinovosyl transferase SQD2 [Diplonema papillatum]|nr:Sulfoquinovosyl transferase SQD2 [Diplonema papillatum]|eukprot:gene18682-28841_t
MYPSTPSSASSVDGEKKAFGDRQRRWVWEVLAAIPILLFFGYLEVVQVRQLLASGEMASARLRKQRQPSAGGCGGDGAPGPCLTVFVTTYKRKASAHAAASHYRFCPSVAEVRLVWAESEEPPFFDDSRGAPVHVDNHYPSTSLNARFKPLREVSTAAVFSVDDDVRVTCRDLSDAFAEWRRQPGRLVGFFPRVVERDYAGAWRYRAFPSVHSSGRYSIILTKAAVLPTRLLEVYSADEPKQISTRLLVERQRNCEDIALQFVAAYETGLAPLFYSPRDEVVDYGSWLFGLWMSGLSSRRAAGQHMMARSQCVALLHKIWNTAATVPLEERRNATDPGLMRRTFAHSDTPLPLSTEVAGTGRWMPATGWEVLSSDLWAPVMVSMPPLVCIGILCVCCFVLYRLNCRQQIKPPTSPSLLILKLARCLLVAGFVCVCIMLLDCCRNHVKPAPRPALPTCSYPHLATPPPPLLPPEHRLRIAVFTGVYSGVVDGVSLTLNKMVQYFLDVGHEVLVFSPDNPVPTGIPNYSGRVVRVSGWSGYLLGRPEYYYAVGIGKTAQAELDAFKPDVVHIATPDGAAVEVQAWAQARGVPTLCSYHTRFNTYFRYYGLGHLLEPIYWQSVAPFFNTCTRVLPPTDAVRDELKANGITTRIDLWPRGVDTATFTPDKRCAGWRAAARAAGEIEVAGAPDEVVILLACRLVLEKNLKLFVDLLNRLSAAGVAFRSVVVGDGGARAWMEQQLPGTRFMGRADEKTMSIAYASADIFLYPSVTETWGNVVLEAMASGLPVIGANASGTAALVRHNETGFIADPEDPDAFLRYLVALVDNPQLRLSMSRRARAVAETYTWASAFNKLNSYYSDTLLTRKR